MTIYRCLFFDILRPVRKLELRLADDPDALDAARGLSSDHAVEVYDADRFVARVNAGDQPPGVRDRIRKEADIHPDSPLVDADC